MISTLYVAISFPPIERQDDVNRRSRCRQCIRPSGISLAHAVRHVNGDRLPQPQAGSGKSGRVRGQQ